MTEIQEIKAEIEQLTPLSDADIQMKVDAGQDAGELLEIEATKETQRRALQFKLNTLEKQEAETRKLDAQRALDKLQIQIEKVEGRAGEQVAIAWAAIQALGNALAAFQQESDEHTRLSQNAKQQANQAGQTATETAGLWLSAQPMEAALIGALQPFRRGKPFNAKLVELED